MFSAVAADCRKSKGLLCGVFVCFLSKGLLREVNCSVKSSKRYLLFALVAVAPVILILFEYIFFKFISDQTPMYLLSAMAGSWQWLEPVVTRILPAVSGALTFLYHNIKEEEL